METIENAGERKTADVWKRVRGGRRESGKEMGSETSAVFHSPSLSRSFAHFFDCLHGPRAWHRLRLFPRTHSTSSRGGTETGPERAAEIDPMELFESFRARWKRIENMAKGTRCEKKGKASTKRSSRLSLKDTEKLKRQGRTSITYTRVIQGFNSFLVE